MQFQELVQKVLEVYDRYSKENDIPVNEDYAVLKLVEEVGEFSQAVIIQRGMCRAEKRVAPAVAQKAVAAELADILGLTILCADRMGVDLQGAIREKWLTFLKQPAKTQTRTQTRTHARTPQESAKLRPKGQSMVKAKKKTQRGAAR